MLKRKTSHLRMTLVLTAIMTLVLSACGDNTATPVPATTAATATTAAKSPVAGTTQAANLDQLVAAAKQEGSLTTIALPHDWCGYGDLITNFKQKYGLQVTELNPDGSSGDEIEAIKANTQNKGPQAPDVIDVGLSFGPQAKAANLIQPYKVSTWATIPDTAKDAEGYWYGDYYGVMAMSVNTDVVKNPPAEWADLLKPEYKGKVALSGDPRTAAQAIAGVYAVALAQGGSLDNAQAGIDFFASLNKAGNFVPVIAKGATLASGETPIVLGWDYNALAAKDSLKGNPPVSVVVPTKGVLAGVYVQAISAYAPHPNAAKLWMEYLYSDAGQLGWLKGYCHPIRYNDLASRNAIPADVAAKLPPAANYATAQFPTLDQYSKATALITKSWDSAVGANVK
ncbi:ABC transporter substrate-binding protein [Candidatus Chlorohelix allophototropha]|uniref:ABC transporter substrate-binding protein n=2 Tax=Candidatus Chlorohelix allophototropha TaxID=3003348 RepID=A0ABY9B7E0_9CHLR|nr:ABC transporter substrate-binding protein [Chloroflexota bacterium L227-S17]